jgi:hypothetical protein
MAFQTEFPFTLPRGYIDPAGQIHKNGTMRLATAVDEIQSVQNPLVQANEAYLPVVLLSRVITHLGELSTVTTRIIEGLFSADLLYLEDLYLRLNCPTQVLLETVCPSCGQSFQVEVAPLGESG